MSLPGRGGMDLPLGGSVLDRVKMFLPVIAAANEELQQKILKEGQEAVQIDSHLNEPEVSGQVPPSDSKMITEDDESSDEEDNENTDNNDITEEPQTQKIVELNFALGDFDDTNIALLEELGKEEDHNDDDEQDNDEDS